MKAFILFVLLIFTSNTFSQNGSPQFSEPKGMEDQSINTNLFYRIYSVEETPYGCYTDNSIYHFDLMQEQLGLLVRGGLETSLGLIGLLANC